MIVWTVRLLLMFVAVLVLGSLWLFGMALKEWWEGKDELQ